MGWSPELPDFYTIRDLVEFKFQHCLPNCAAQSPCERNFGYIMYEICFEDKPGCVRGKIRTQNGTIGFNLI
jgi:hypothetical protein